MKSFDASLRTAWPAVPFVGLLAIAYFQANGIGALVAAHVAGPLPTPAPPVHRTAALARAEHRADPILERNPFDSETGPLGRFAPRVTVPPASSAQQPVDPATAATCDFGYVTVIALSDDPGWSFAAIEVKGGDNVLRRVGGAVSGHTVQHVSWDRVWLAGSSGLCQLKLGDKPEVKKRRPQRNRRTRRRRSSRARLPSNIASKIRKVGAHEYVVERAAIDEILENQAMLFRSTRVRPIKEGTAVTGMKLSRIRSGTLLYTLGVRNGDVVQGINGFALTDPQKALQAYGRLRTADHLALSLTRKGKPLTIDIDIR